MEKYTSISGEVEGLCFAPRLPSQHYCRTTPISGRTGGAAEFSSSSHPALISKISGVLNSLTPATEAEIDRLEKRNVKEECCHLHGVAPAF